VIKLKVPLIVVLGHSCCGAVQATLDRELTGFELPTVNLNALADELVSSVQEAIQNNEAKMEKDDLLKEGHLRWESLGEFLALSESLAHLARKNQHAKAQVLAETLDRAAGKLMENKKSPGRKVKAGMRPSATFNKILDSLAPVA
jgi:carbonic anhydrase